jgi:hypothetical protein
MQKILQFIDSLGLATTASKMSSYAKTINGDLTRHSLDSEVDRPKTSWDKMRQTIQVHVPCHSQDLIKLWIYVPRDFESQIANIEITDRKSAQQMRHKLTVATPICRQDRWLQINFARAIAPDTNLQIDFARVSRNLLTRSCEYFVYGKSATGQSCFVGRGYFPLAKQF